MPRGRPRKVSEILEQAIIEADPKNMSATEIYNTLNDDNQMVENELNQQSDEEAADQQPIRPRYIDPGWHYFVMTQFVPEELDPKGNPKVDGLRRVAEGLLGQIVESRPVQSSSDSSLAAVNWILIIEWACDNPYIDIGDREPLPRRIFGAFADASKENCKSPYNKFLSSLADTRAESKCLRRALRLRCISSEEAELGETNTFEEEVSDGNYNGEAPINPQQIMMVSVLSQRLGIDQDKLSVKTYNKQVKLLTKENAANLIILLNKYQTSVKEQSSEIPDDVKLQ